MRISDWSSDVCSSDLEGSGFAAGLTLAGADLDAGLVASGLLATGTLGGVEASGFGLLALDDSFTFLLDRPVEGPEPPIPEPPINVVYLIDRSEEHTSELQSLMRISYAVFCLQKKNNEIK